jgi:hypothetical protein
MIQLHSDCLVFKSETGQAIPCSAELVTIELIGEAARLLDPDLLQHAAAAVLHYFKEELGRSTVSMSEFSQALEHILRTFGLMVDFPDATQKTPRISDLDLRKLAFESGKGFELVFFPRLRDELRKSLKESPSIVRFQGLRSCVKQLSGAHRWSPRCEKLSDQIVAYLRLCWSSEVGTHFCALVVL